MKWSNLLPTPNASVAADMVEVQKAGMRWSNLHMPESSVDGAVGDIEDVPLKDMDMTHLSAKVYACETHPSSSSSASPSNVRPIEIVSTLTSGCVTENAPQNSRDSGLPPRSGASETEISEILDTSVAFDAQFSDCSVDPCCVCYLGLKDGQSMVPLGCGHPVCLQCALLIPHGLCPICRAPTLAMLQEEAKQAKLLIIQREADRFRRRVCFSLSVIFLLLTVYCASQYVGISPLPGSGSGSNRTRLKNNTIMTPARINGVPKRTRKKR